MSDEALIDEIRTAMRSEVEDLRPADELLAPVLAAAPRRRRVSLGWLMPAVAVGVAGLVAVIAVTSLEHRAPTAGSAPASIPVGARRLAARLAVLRRAQRPADVLPAWAVRETESLTDHAKVVTGLSRYIGSVNMGQYGHARVYLVVQRPPHFPVHRSRPGPPLLNPRLGDVATIAFVGPFREEAAINGPTVAAGGEQVAGTVHGLTAEPGQFTNLWGAVASVVPDGVARVKWVFTPDGQDSGLPPITVWPKIRGNVAIGRLRGNPQVYLSTAVWYGTDGHVLASFGTSPGPTGNAANFKRALDTSVHDPVAAVLQRHFAVLRARRGQLPRPQLGRTLVASLIEPNPVDLDIAKARFVTLTTPPAKLLLVPGTQGMALRALGPVMGQATGGTPAVLDGQLIIVGPSFAGRRTIYGVAPDGNRIVSVPLPGGGVRTAPVINNVYAISVPADARILVLRNASGRVVRIRFG